MYVRIKISRILEWLLLATGVTLLIVFAAALVNRSVLSRVALARFDQAQTANVAAKVEAQADAAVDVSLWSPKRIRGFRESLLAKIDPPLGVLRLDRLLIRVPVFEGTGDLILNRGAGWIEGTARPGTAGNGNVGIAAHRDGFFRGLRGIRVGDVLELSTPRLAGHYAVDGVEIVNPENVGVLQPRGAPSLTLVTCYPFDFVGAAPKRFIVYATLKQQVATNSGSASREPHQSIVPEEKNHD